MAACAVRRSKDKENYWINGPLYTTLLGVQMAMKNIGWNDASIEWAHKEWTECGLHDITNLMIWISNNPKKLIHYSDGLVKIIPRAKVITFLIFALISI